LLKAGPAPFPRFSWSDEKADQISYHFASLFAPWSVSKSVPLGTSRFALCYEIVTKINHPLVGDALVVESPGTLGGLVRNIARILAKLKNERDRIDQAINAIEKLRPGTPGHNTGRSAQVSDKSPAAHVTRAQNKSDTEGAQGTNVISFTPKRQQTG
jgi:hypothetical protein